ncbi:ABC transporter, substrate-binding protein, family 5 [Clostridiales bacterium oral taxon 876 str. F0540]|nr:ABC transporter, substrate-binding protein, family 5 [Clostridiales bacterium oral taxon 876 str. F0540]
MKKFISFIMIFFMLSAGGCVEKKTEIKVYNNRTDKNIVYNMGKLPDDLIMLKDSKIRDKDLLLSLFEGLIKVDEFGNITPGIAESWNIGKDNITYTFKLREDAKWSDGEDITAKDFVDFYKEILASKQDNVYAYQLYYIFGAEEYRKNKKGFNGVAIRAVDDRTLEFRLNSPVSCFLEILSQPVYSLRKVNDSLKTWKKSYKNIVYSGPFTITDVSESGEVELAKNKYYYDKDEVKADKLYITSSAESEKAMAEFMNKKINLFINPPISESANLIAEGKAEAIPIESGSSISFNLKKPGITNDINFRKAISLSISRKSLVQDDLNHVARSASAYVPYDDQDNVQNKQEKHLVKEEADAAAAHKLLEESKYDKKEKIKLIYLDNNENKRLCEALYKEIKDNLNISIDYKGYNEVELKEAVKKGDYHMMIINYASLYNDPLSLLEAWTENSALNVFGYSNSEYNKLIYEAKYENDRTKRLGLLQNSEKILMNDMPTIPLYFHNILLCKNTNIKDVIVTKEGNIRLDRAYIEK